MNGISVAENRGSLAKKSKALDIRVFGIRNRLEDQHLELKYISTVEMVADLGTKNLGPVRFKMLRDIMNGYALSWGQVVAKCLCQQRQLHCGKCSTADAEGEGSSWRAWSWRHVKSGVLVRGDAALERTGIVLRWQVQLAIVRTHSGL